MPFRIPFIEKFPVRVILLQKRGNAVTAREDRGRYIIKGATRLYELKKYGIKFQPTSYENLIPMNNGQPFVLLYEYDRGMVVPIDTNNMQTIYEYDNNKVVMTKVKYKCSNGHAFLNPFVKEYGILKKKKKDQCPYCFDEMILEYDNIIEKPKIKKVVNLNPVDEDMMFWGQMRRQKSEERHKNQSWLERNQTMIMTGMMFVFFIVLSYIFMNSISENTNDIVSALQTYAGPVPQG